MREFFGRVFSGAGYGLGFGIGLSIWRVMQRLFKLALIGLGSMWAYYHGGDAGSLLTFFNHYFGGVF